MRIPLATDLKTRTARATPVGTAVTGVQMLNNGSGFAQASPFAETIVTNTLTGFSPSSGNLSGCHAIAWNGSLYCIVGSPGAGTVYCATSPDGLTWTPRVMPALGNWLAVAWNGTVFCAVGATNAITDGTVCATSPDGITWTGHTIITSKWREITSFNGLFVAVGFSFTTSLATIATSPDGITWTSRTPPVVVAADILISLVNSPTRLVVMFSTLAYANTTWVSTDGINWTVGAIPVYPIAGATWNGNIFYAVSHGTSAASSPDGLTWAARTAPNVYQNGIASTGTIIGLVNGTSPGRFFTSEDGGVTWKWGALVSSGFPNWRVMAGNGVNFIGMSDDSSPLSFSAVPGLGLFPLTFTGGVGTGAAGTYTVDAFGSVVSNPVVTAGGNYSTMPVVSFLYGGGQYAVGLVLPTGLPQIPDTDSRMTNSYITGPSSGGGIPEVTRRPGISFQATIGAGRAQGGIAVGSHVFTINNDIGRLT